MLLANRNAIVYGDGGPTPSGVAIQVCRPTGRPQYVPATT